jgi:hypothetical protein
MEETGKSDVVRDTEAVGVHRAECATQLLIPEVH